MSGRRCRRRETWRAGTPSGLHDGLHVRRDGLLGPGAGPGTAVYRDASGYAAIARISTRSPALARPLTPMIVQVG